MQPSDPVLTQFIKDSARGTPKIKEAKQTFEEYFKSQKKIPFTQANVTVSDAEEYLRKCGGYTEENISLLKAAYSQKLSYYSHSVLFWRIGQITDKLSVSTDNDDPQQVQMLVKEGDQLSYHFEGPLIFSFCKFYLGKINYELILTQEELSTPWEEKNHYRLKAGSEKYSPALAIFLFDPTIPLPGSDNAFVSALFKWIDTFHPLEPALSEGEIKQMSLIIELLKDKLSPEQKENLIKYTSSLNPHPKIDAESFSTEINKLLLAIFKMESNPEIERAKTTVLQLLSPKNRDLPQIKERIISSLLTSSPADAINICRPLLVAMLNQSAEQKVLEEVLLAILDKSKADLGFMPLFLEFVQLIHSPESIAFAQKQWIRFKQSNPGIDEGLVMDVDAYILEKKYPGLLKINLGQGIELEGAAQSFNEFCATAEEKAKPKILQLIDFLKKAGCADSDLEALSRTNIVKALLVFLNDIASKIDLPGAASMPLPLSLNKDSSGKWYLQLPKASQSSSIIFAVNGPFGRITKYTLGFIDNIFLSDYSTDHKGYEVHRQKSITFHLLDKIPPEQREYWMLQCFNAINQCNWAMNLFDYIDPALQDFLYALITKPPSFLRKATDEQLKLFIGLQFELISQRLGCDKENLETMYTNNKLAEGFKLISEFEKLISDIKAPAPEKKTDLTGDIDRILDNTRITFGEETAFSMILTLLADDKKFIVTSYILTHKLQPPTVFEHLLGKNDYLAKDFTVKVKSVLSILLINLAGSLQDVKQQNLDQLVNAIKASTIFLKNFTVPSDQSRHFKSTFSPLVDLLRKFVGSPANESLPEEVRDSLARLIIFFDKKSRPSGGARLFEKTPQAIAGQQPASAQQLGGQKRT